MANLIQLKRSAVPGHVPVIATGPTDHTGLQLGEMAINTYDARVFSRQQQLDNNIDQVFEVGLKGATAVKQVYYVSKSGNDANTGTSLDQSKLTIKSAVEATRGMNATATVTSAAGVITGVTLVNGGAGYNPNYPPKATIFDATGTGAKVYPIISADSVTGFQIIDGGTGYSLNPTIYIEPSGADAVIFVKSGDYTEYNPIYIPKGVSVVGDSLRTTTIRPANPGLDIFWVNNKSYFTEMTFRGHQAPSAVYAFPGIQVSNVSNTSPARVTFAGRGLQFNRGKSYRDAGLLVDSLAQDLLFGASTVSTYQSGYGSTSFSSGITVGQSQSTFAGKQYWNQTGLVFPSNELSAVLSSLTQIQTDLNNLSISTATKTIITNEIALISNIISNYATPLDVTNLIVPNGTTVIGNTGDISTIQSNRSTIQAALQTYVSGIPGLNLSPTQLALCVRDVGYIIDSICYDIKYGGNRQAIQAGTYYLGYSSTSSAIPNIAADCIRSWKYLQVMMGYILKNIPLPNTYQSNWPQTYLSNTGTDTEVTAINNNLQLVIDTAVNGTGPFWTGTFTATFSGTTMTVVSVPTTYTLTPGYQLSVTGATNTTPIVIASGSGTSFTLNQAPTGVSGTVTISAGPPAMVPIGLTPGTGNTLYAYNLLEANREFIKEELIAYLDGFSYNRDNCSRDVGLIVDALAQDLMSEGATQSTFAAIQYWSQGVKSTALVIAPAELAATVAAVQYIGTIAQTYVSTTAERNFIQAELNTIASIINGNPAPVQVFDNPTAQTATAIVNAYNALKTNKTNIANSLITWITANYPGLTYSQATCKRDVGFILDAVAYDLLYNIDPTYVVPSNRQAILAGKQYRSKTNNDVFINPTEKLAILDVIDNYLKPQTVAAVSTTAEKAFVTAEFDLLYAIINAGTSGVTDTIIPNKITANTATAIANAYAAIQSALSTLQSGTLNYINTNYPGMLSSAQQATCSRDVGYILNSISFDLLYNADPTYVRPSNRQVIQAGVYYYGYNGISVISGELGAVTSAYEYINTLAGYIIEGKAPPASYQSLIGITALNLVTQTFPVTPNLIGTAQEANTVKDNINLMLDIIVRGPSVAPQPRPIPLVRSTTDTTINAATLLEANRAFITAEVVAYSDYSFSYGHPYNSGDAVSFRQVQGMYQLNNDYIHQIVGATNAQPVQLTFSKGHTFANKSEIKIHGVQGMSELNWDPKYQTNRYYTQYVDSTHVNLFYDVNLQNPVDGTSFGTFTTPSQGPFTSVSSTAISSVTLSGTTGTVNFSGSHGLATGQFVELSGFTDARWNGVYSISVTSPTAFTITFPESQNTNITATWLVDTTPPSAPSIIGTITVSAGCGDADPFYYVKVIDSQHCDLYLDHALTQPVNATLWSKYIDGGVAGTGSLPMSPYVHNCSSITSTGTGMRVDGHLSTGLRSMVLDSFTQINEGGIGIEIVNRGYAQLVSIYTICTDKGVHTQGGGFCSLENSNCSFGNYALYADGLSEVLYTGATDGVNQTGTLINLKNMSKRPNYDDALDIQTVLPINTISTQTIPGVPNTIGFAPGAKLISGTVTVNTPGSGYLPNQLIRLDGGTLGTVPGLNVTGNPSVFQVTAVELVSVGTINSGNRGTRTYTVGDILQFNSGFSRPASVKVTQTSGGSALGQSGYLVAVQIVTPGVKYTASTTLTPSYITPYGSTSSIPVISPSTGSDTSIPFVFGLNSVSLTTNPLEYYTVAPTGTSMFGNQVQNIGTTLVTQTLGSVGYTGSASGSFSYNYYTDVVSPTATGGSVDVNFTIRLTFSELTYFRGGEQVTLNGIGGMTALNGNTYYINLIGQGNQADIYDDIDLKTGVDPTLFTAAYTSGGADPLGGTATLDDYYTVIAAGAPTIDADTGALSIQITLEETVYRPIPDSTKAAFRQRSRIQASGQGLEFIGSGTVLATATPQSGAYPIDSNAAYMINGGKVFFTGTNEQGDFLIGNDLTINNDTGTISGRTFNKSLFAIMTPYILALEG